MQRKGQMQLLVLQGENKPVNTFTKKQHLTNLGLIALLLGKEWCT